MIDADAADSALSAGAIDTCLLYARQSYRTGEREAALNRDLAEALFHCERRDEAIECGRRALANAPGDPKTLYFCAWLFSNCSCHEDAASAYQDLLAIYPTWTEGYRHASGSLAEIGAIAKASEFAVEASTRDPQNFEYALHAGNLLLRAGRHADAADHLRYAAYLDPEDQRTFRGLAEAYCALGQRDRAVELAQHAAVDAPEDAQVAVFAAELLLQCDRADAAIAILQAAATRDASDPALFRTLSSAQMVRGHFENALAAVDLAITIAPEVAEYHIHRGFVLVRLGQMRAAEVGFEQAARLDPMNPELKRAQIELCLAQGRITDATALGGWLLREHPDDPAAAATVLHVLGERMDTIDAEYMVVLHNGTERPPRPLRPLPGFRDRLQNQRRVIRALIIRETRTRFGESRLGYGWALLEPILHIALLSVAFSLLMRGQPPIGSHFFLFYYTGLVPYHVFVHTSSSMMHAITGNGALLQLPLVTPFDAIAARGILEIVTDVIVAMIMLLVFGAFGVAAAPDDFWGPMTAFLAVAMLGCGVGYVNAVLTMFWRGWDKIYAQVTRALYFISGIFYVPAIMPNWIRDALLWNPLLHAIDWFRSGFFASYQPHWLDRFYLVMLAILVLLAGIAVERALRRRLSETL